MVERGEREGAPCPHCGSACDLLRFNAFHFAYHLIRVLIRAYDEQMEMNPPSRFRELENLNMRR